MLGRWAVWPHDVRAASSRWSPTTWVAEALLYLGLAMTLWATAMYVRDGVPRLRAKMRQTLKLGA